MKSLTFIIFLLVFTVSCFAGVSGKELVDSLLKELPKYREDSNKLMMLDEIANAFGETYPDESIKYEQEELELATRLNMPKFIGRAYGHLGSDYATKSDFTKALEFMQLGVKTQALQKNKVGIAEEKTRIAKLYESKKMYDSSFVYYRDALSIFDTLQEKGKSVELMLYLGFTCKLQNKYESSLDYCYRALEINKGFDPDISVPLRVALEGVIGEAYLGIAKDESKKNDHRDEQLKNAHRDSAIKYLENAITGNEKEGNLNNATEFSRALTDLCILAGNYKKAFEVLKAGHILEDSLKDTKDAKVRETMEVIHKINESRIALENKELKTEKKARLFFVAAICVSLIFVIYIFVNFKKQQKANFLLSAEKKKSETLLAEIREKNTAITDNINYAQRIQSAILPDINLIYKTLEQSFILYLPKDIVSGDFYAFAEKNRRTLLISGDCTGHGVSGAFMSMIGSSLINEIINEKGIVQPAQILDQLNVAIIEALRQSASETSVTDGMDIAICSFDMDGNELQFSGANRPLWLIRNQEIIIIAPDKFPIGGLQSARDRSFTNNKMLLNAGDTIYMFTDGYADQFGGEKGKKIMTAKFKEILLTVQKLNMREQEAYLKDYFQKWKGINEQVDDVLVIGVRV